MERHIHIIYVKRNLVKFPLQIHPDFVTIIFMAKASLTKEDILHLAKLANLQITDAEVEKYLNQLEQTLDYVENLSELDTSKVDASASSSVLENIFFTDGTENTRGLSQEEVMQNAHSKKGNAFKVTRIL